MLAKVKATASRHARARAMRPASRMPANGKANRSRIPMQDQNQTERSRKQVNSASRAHALGVRLHMHHAKTAARPSARPQCMAAQQHNNEVTV
ncbi:hypothetical protein J8I87_33265 [Paraburkholderia sp. LEh10]|uniref:hypothetical protein n=1 Tax=Paraburkholderia sp. LEh10 TaxID=2821353 RepID=UPI001AEA9F87|nr:hypothetical protein [Paraburkholderia sp. LEh10]MBP0594452.1 hypothetical protein [Paraburkholderia sp. LEh10]